MCVCVCVCVCVCARARAREEDWGGLVMTDWRPWSKPSGQRCCGLGRRGHQRSDTAVQAAGSGLSSAYTLDSWVPTPGRVLGGLLTALPFLPRDRQAWTSGLTLGDYDSHAAANSKTVDEMKGLAARWVETGADAQAWAGRTCSRALALQRACRAQPMLPTSLYSRWGWVHPQRPAAGQQQALAAPGRRYRQASRVWTTPSRCISPSCTCHRLHLPLPLPLLLCSCTCPLLLIPP
jgi:hypothetical protein